MSIQQEGRGAPHRKPGGEVLRVLELYCGIGGFAAALRDGPGSVGVGSSGAEPSVGSPPKPAGAPLDREPARCQVVAALDIDRVAVEVYGRNFSHPAAVRTLESVSATELRRWRADLWWLSPPCQPFTRRGKGGDDLDPRAGSFLELLRRLEEAPPAYLALENVPGFRGSRTHAALRATLDRLGYTVQELDLCPTELGIPNRRRRFYLVAGRPGLRQLPPLRSTTPPGMPADDPPLLGPADFRDGAESERSPRTRTGQTTPAVEPLPFASSRLADHLDADPAPGLRVEPALAERYRHALDVVDPEDPGAVAACFTSAYGHSPVRSGSYLRTREGLRRFSPAEILRLLGFPADFTLPPEMPLRTGWRLAGNSLSIPAVRHLLSAVPGVEAASPAETITAADALNSGGAGAGRAVRG